MIRIVTLGLLGESRTTHGLLGTFSEFYRVEEINFCLSRRNFLGRRSQFSVFKIFVDPNKKTIPPEMVSKTRVKRFLCGFSLQTALK